jgi:VIT1/CCC1 family predicted Fe2+/Mn2+ transporter
MAAGEYISVSSQADTEAADLARERAELAATPKAEQDELSGIYVSRGVEPALAAQVAQQMIGLAPLKWRGICSA